MEEIFTERVKNIYAAENACLFALSKIQITAPVNEPMAGPGDEEIEFDSAKPWIPDPEPYKISMGELGCDVYIEDEGGKFNINTIKDGTKEMFIEFLSTKKINKEDAESITDAILDWIDKDELHHVNGAESPYYKTLPDPYSSKNANFDSVEELLLIKGVTPLIYDEIRDSVTVFGSDKININFADRDILLSVPGLKEDAVNEILKYIEASGPFKDFETFKTVLFGVGIAGASYEDVKKFLSIDNQSYVTVRAICSSSSIPQKETSDDNEYNYNDDEDMVPGEAMESDGSGHQYRIIAQIEKGRKHILAVYPD